MAGQGTKARLVRRLLLAGWGGGAPGGNAAQGWPPGVAGAWLQGRDLVDELSAYPYLHVRGFTVPDNSMIYVGFVDEPLSRIIGIAIIAPHAAEAVLIARRRAARATGRFSPCRRAWRYC